MSRSFNFFGCHFETIHTSDLIFLLHLFVCLSVVVMIFDAFVCLFVCLLFFLFSLYFNSGSNFNAKFVRRSMFLRLGPDLTTIPRQEYTRP